MSWNFLISFAIGFVVYFVLLVLWALFKRHRMKKQVEHEDEQVEKIEVNIDEEHKD